MKHTKLSIGAWVVFAACFGLVDLILTPDLLNHPQWPYRLGGLALGGIWLWSLYKLGAAIFRFIKIKLFMRTFHD